MYRSKSIKGLVTKKKIMQIRVSGKVSLIANEREKVSKGNISHGVLWLTEMDAAMFIVWPFKIVNISE